MANAGSFVTGTGSRSGSANRGKQLGYGVGRFEFLDSEDDRAFRYWRQIEFGSSIHVGRFLGGAWGGAGGGRGARHGQELTRFGAGAGQQFIPYSHTMALTKEGAIYSAHKAAGLLVEQEGRQERLPVEGERSFGAGGYIVNPIEPHEAYSRAFAKFDGAQKELAAIRQLFGEIIREAKGAPLTNLSAAGNVQEFIGVRIVSAPNVARLRQDFSSGALGTFPTRLLELNRVLAEELAAAVVEELVLVRPDVSSHTLRDAILDPRNRFPQ